MESSYSRSQRNYFSFSGNLPPCFSKYKISEYSNQNQNNYSFLNNKRNKSSFHNNNSNFISEQTFLEAEKFKSQYIFCTEKGPITRSNSYFSDIIKSQNLNQIEKSFGIFSQSTMGNRDDNKILQKSSYKKPSKSNNFNLYNEEEEDEERILDNENIPNTANNKENNNINRNTKTTLPNSNYIELMERNNKIENKKKKNSKGIRSDDLNDVIKNAFFNSVYKFVYKNITDLKLMIKREKIQVSIFNKNIEKMIPLTNELKKKPKYFKVHEQCSKQVKDMFITDENPEYFYRKKNKKTENYININEFKKNNNNNKEIINMIEEMYNNKDDKKYKKIKDNISLLFDILNKNLNKMFLEFLDSENLNKLKNFEHIDKIQKEMYSNKSEEYLKEFHHISSKIAFG